MQRTDALRRGALALIRVCGGVRGRRDDPRRDRSWAALRRMIVVVLSASLVLLSPGALEFAVAFAQPSSTPTPAEHVAAFTDRIADLRHGLDRTSFDLDALAMELAFEDAETIVAWVRDRIAFEAYEGLLRGPHGTLVGGAGNSIDQAVLLARLLNDAGYEAEVVQGRLDEDGVAALLSTLSPAGSSNAPVSVAAMGAAVNSLVEFAASMGITIDTMDLDPQALVEAEPLEAPALAVVERDATALISVIGIEAEGWPQAVARNDLEAAWDETATYYWVEYRLSPRDPWVQAHPVVPAGGASFAPVGEERRFAGVVPPDLMHQVRFEVEISVLRGDRVEWVPVIAPWERPAASLFGDVLAFANVSDNAEQIESALVDMAAGREGAADALEAAKAATTFYFPYLNGQPAPGAMAFDTLGNVAPLDAATHPAAGVFAEVARGFGGTAGAVAGLGESRPVESSALVSQRFVFTLLVPGGQETRYERTVFDRAEGNDPAAGLTPIDDLASDLLVSQATMVAVAKPSTSYLLDRIYGALLASTDALTTFGNTVYGSDLLPEEVTHELVRSLMAVAHPLELDLLLLADAFEGGVPDGVMAYRDAPAVTSIRVGVPSEQVGTVEMLVDIVSNPRRVLRRAGSEITAAPAEEVWLGVRDTYVERELMRSVAGVDPAAPAVGSAITMLADLRTADILVLRDLSDVALDQLSGDERTLAAVRADLTRGYIVVLPNSPLAYEQATWWRIDPRTGETLGIMRGGEGAAAAERTIITALATLIAHVAVGIVVYVTCRLAIGFLRAVDEITGGPPYRPPSATCLPGAVVGGVFGSKGPLLGLLTTILMSGLGIEDPPPTR